MPARPTEGRIIPLDQCLSETGSRLARESRSHGEHFQIRPFYGCQTPVG